jgi:hypothetical protein
MVYHSLARLLQPLILPAYALSRNRTMRVLEPHKVSEHQAVAMMAEKNLREAAAELNWLKIADTDACPKIVGAGFERGPVNVDLMGLVPGLERPRFVAAHHSENWYELMALQNGPVKGMTF